MTLRGKLCIQRLALVLLISSAGFSLTWAANNVPENQTYLFGVFPYLSAARLEPIYSPVSAQLTRELKHDVAFRTASRFQRFFAKLERQYYDIALIQPFWYPPAIDQFGYLPLVRVEEPFSALIMVPENSPLKNIADLKGKIIATPPAFVPVVHMARRALQKAGLVPDQDVQLKAFRSVDSCFQQVFIGAADACITPPFAVAVVEEKMNIRLRVLLKTPPIPSMSIVVHSRIPAAEREHLKSILLSWRDNKTGQKLLNGIKTQGFVPSVDAEYDVVRHFLHEIKQSK